MPLQATVLPIIPAKKNVTSPHSASDRFVPARSPRKLSREIYMLLKAPTQLTEAQRRSRQQSPLSNPFNVTAMRKRRQLDHPLNNRAPSSGWPVSNPGTPASVQGPGGSMTGDRAASAGSVWTVSGNAPLDGVQSTSDGRGGRIVSGTNAPLYSSNFLSRTEHLDDTEGHGRRLAAAFEIDQANRVFESPGSRGATGSPLRTAVNGTGSSQSPQGSRLAHPMAWRDSQWICDDPTSPQKKRVGPHKLLPTIPFRVLDAPALRDDFYCSLLAYSHTAQCLAVGLGSHVYLWSETQGVNTRESLTSAFTGHVTSLSFSSTEGGHAILAVGRADGRVTLWSPFDKGPRFDSEQPAPVSCIAFSSRPFRRMSIREPACRVYVELLLIGDEVGHVYLYSIEWPSELERDLYDWHGSMTLLARLTAHTQQICGLGWSASSDLFATGGNDNSLFLFETKKILLPTNTNSTNHPRIRVRPGNAGNSTSTIAGQQSVSSIPATSAKHHFRLNAAVKALSFSPWQPGLLAAGGGSNDRAIHFYHSYSGATLATIDCSAQVTSLTWSTTRREICATFGFAQPEHPYRVAVYEWPSCRQVFEIPWYGEERALWAIAYPGGPGSAAEGAIGGGSRDARSRTRRGRGGFHRAGGRDYADNADGPITRSGSRRAEESCLVVATSDASIKFHEVWGEGSGRVGLGVGGCLGGSDILEALHGVEKEGREVIR